MLAILLVVIGVVVFVYGMRKENWLLGLGLPLFCAGILLSMVPVDGYILSKENARIVAGVVRTEMGEYINSSTGKVIFSSRDKLEGRIFYRQDVIHSMVGRYDGAFTWLTFAFPADV